MFIYWLWWKVGGQCCVTQWSLLFDNKTMYQKWQDLDSSIIIHLAAMEFTCRYCDTTFTKRFNLKRHIIRKHDTKSIHHHGLQLVNKLYITRETYCFLHQGKINRGKMFYCYACNFGICASCVEEDCKFCKIIFVPIKSPQIFGVDSNGSYFLQTLHATSLVNSLNVWFK